MKTQVLDSIREGKYTWKEYLLLLAMLIISADTVMFGTNSNELYINIRYVFVAILILVYGKSGINVLSKGSTTALVMVAMSVLLVFTGVMCHELTGGYFVRFSLILLAFCYTSNVEKGKFMYMFSDAMYFISLFSIVCYVLFWVAPVVFSVFPSVTNISGFEFKNLWFCVLPTDYRLSNRLFGPFSEPGLYQILLNVALAFDIYQRNSLNYFRIGAFVGAIVLTKSTAGYIILAVVLAYLVFSIRRRKTDKSSYWIVLLLALAAFLLSLYTDLLSANGMVFNKLQDDGTSRNTTVARMASVTCNIQMFLESPLWGVGLVYADEMFPRLAAERYGLFVGSNTNQLLFQFASMGFFYGMLWMIGVGKFFLRLGNSIITKILLFVIFILLCVGENLTWSLLFYLFIMYGFKNQRPIQN